MEVAMRTIVKDVMSADPVSVRESLSFKELAARIRESGVSALPVLDGAGRVIGVVSESDLLAKEALSCAAPAGLVSGIAHRRDRRKAAGVTARDLMTSPAVTVAPDDTIERAARLMYERGFERFPVVDAVGRLIGTLSRADALAVFDRPDEEIRLEIIGQVIPRLSDPSWYSVIVHDGIVTLEGTPETISVGRDVLGKVRRVPGVVAVRDRLVYPPRPVPVAPGPYF
jgi:CBS domain-containing protein